MPYCWLPYRVASYFHECSLHCTYDQNYSVVDCDVCEVRDQ